MNSTATLMKNKNYFHPLNLFLLLALITGVKSIFGQTIKFTNPSFEGNSWEVISDNQWTDCGFEAESPPDIQPGAFMVTMQARDGNNYLGMVVRDNNTWEMVSQKLSGGLLEKNNCYDFSVDLCRSLIYESTSRLNYMPVSYNEPVLLRVWGGNNACEKNELLFQSPLITNTDWKTFNVRLHPQKNSYSYIVFEAYYKANKPYNGNILIDKLTNISKVNCKDEFKKDTSKTNTTVAIKAVAPKTHTLEAAKTNPELIKKGDIIQLKKLMFDADKSTIKQESEIILNNVYQMLSDNPQITIEIGGHTNNYPTDVQANELSLKRAKAVHDWLIKKGIAANRLQYKGYGKTQPIASNETLQGREQNQRVEIKILSSGN